MEEDMHNNNIYTAWDVLFVMIETAVIVAMDCLLDISLFGTSPLADDTV